MWAAARRLAWSNDCSLELDLVSGFRGDGFGRQYCLEDLIGPQEMCSAYRGFGGRTGRVRELAALARDRYRVLPPRWITDSPHDLNESILQRRVTGPVYMRGYFQSERYFEDVASELRAEIRFRGRPSRESLALADKIQSSPNPVGVHARVMYSRPQVDDPGDLPPEDVIRAESSFLGRSHYLAASEHISEKVGDVQYFVFSDHPSFAAQELRLPGQVTVVGHNAHGNAAEDLWLLSLCRHHILCESTFGWWGAWLAEHPDQQVVVPSKGYPNRQMMPRRWTVLSDG